MLKAAVIVAAVAITALCGVQIGWMVTHAPAISQASDHGVADQGRILKTDGGGM